MTRPAPIIAGIVATILLLVGAVGGYMVAYYADRPVPANGIDRFLWVMVIENGERPLLYPAHQLHECVWGDE
jgi:hypothetical protein